MKPRFAKRRRHVAGVGLLLAAAALAPPAARAGTYVVHSCGGQGQWQGWTRIEAVGRTSFGTECSGSAPGDGLRAQADNYVFSGGSTVAWSFAAPAGTRIVRLEADLGSSDNRTPASATWWRGIFDPDIPSWMQADRWLASVPEVRKWQRISTPRVSLRRIAIGMDCFYSWCYVPGNEWIAARNMAISLEEAQPPELTVEQAPQPGWRRDPTQAVAVRARDDVSGVRALIVLVNGHTVADVTRACYKPATNTSLQPCWRAAPVPMQASIDLSDAPDGANRVVVRVFDAANNVDERGYTVLVDRHAPPAPRAVVPAGLEAWAAINRFALRWTNPPETDQAPITAAVMDLCPAANGPYDDSGCIRTLRTGHEINHVDDLSVPGPGAWRVRISLRDAAGNVDPQNPGVTSPLRFDDDPPSGSFLPLDPRDPTRVRLSAFDPTSGVGHVSLAARRRGDAAWTELEATPRGDTYTAMVDDAKFPAGRYDIRGHVTDLAGNERTITRLADGTALRLDLPVRTAAKLVVGHPRRIRVKTAAGKKRRKYRRVLVSRTRPRYGRRVALTGRLTDAAGNPHGNAPIEVYERVHLPGMEWRLVTTLRTRTSGAFAFRALAGPARVLRFTYPGTSTTRPRSEAVELAVRAGVTLAPSRRRVRNGQAVVFRGRLLGGPYPHAGKLLTLQARTARGWLTFANPRARASNGRWRYRYRFTGTSVTSRYAFRVLVPEDSSYPYATGVSKVARVLVRGRG